MFTASSYLAHTLSFPFVFFSRSPSSCIKRELRDSPWPLCCALVPSYLFQFSFIFRLSSTTRFTLILPLYTIAVVQRFSMYLSPFSSARNIVVLSIVFFSSSRVCAQSESCLIALLLHSQLSLFVTA